MQRLAWVCVLVAIGATTADAKRRPPPPDFGDGEVGVGIGVPHPPPPPPPPPPVEPAGPMIDYRAELMTNGDAVRLVMTSGSKNAGVAVVPGSGKAMALYNGEGAVGTLKTGHGKTIIALLVDDAKHPFRIATYDGKNVTNVQKLARPVKQSNYPFAVAAATTPDGFTIFFQEVSTTDGTDAHTFMVELDKEGKAGDPKEVAIPWALGDAIWNGNGFHLALFYTGEGRGARLAMVSAQEDGQPIGHPDWSTQPSAISDVHLVSNDGKIQAIYRGGAGDHVFSTDVTKIGQWGQVTAKTTDLGALASNVTLAITAKGGVTKVKTK